MLPSSDPSISEDGSVAAVASRPADGRRTRRLAPAGVDFGPGAAVLSDNGCVAPSDSGAVAQTLLAQAAPTGAVR